MAVRILVTSTDPEHLYLRLWHSPLADLPWRTELGLVPIARGLFALDADADLLGRAVVPLAGLTVTSVGDHPTESLPTAVVPAVAVPPHRCTEPLLAVVREDRRGDALVDLTLPGPAWPQAERPTGWLTVPDDDPWLSVHTHVMGAALVRVARLRVRAAG